MWYIYLKESSLSKDSINTCISNNIHTLQHLMESYSKDNTLSPLKPSSAKIKNELFHFCEEVFSFFKSITKGEEAETQNPLVQKPLNNPMEKDYSLDVLVSMGIIPDYMTEMLLSNQISTASQLINYYNTVGSFKNLRNVGHNKNEILMEAIQKIQNLTGCIIDPTKKDRKSEFYFFGENDIIDIEQIKKALFLWEDELKPLTIEYFMNEIFNDSDSENIKFQLNRLYHKPSLIRGIGKKREAAVRDFLVYCKKGISISTGKDELKASYSAIVIQKSGLCSLSLKELNQLDWNNPVNIIQAIVKNSKKLREEDHFILDNIKSIKITEEKKGLSYEEGHRQLCELLDRDIPFSTFRVWVNRDKKKIETIIAQILEKIPELKTSLENHFKIRNEFHIFSSATLNKINNDNQTDFTNYFYDIIIRQINKNHISFFEKSNKSFAELSYIDKKLITDPKKFTQLVTQLKSFLFRNSPTPLSVGFELLEMDCVQSYKGKEFVKDLLKVHNSLVEVNDVEIFFPPTYEGRKKLIDYIIELFREIGKELHYDELNSEFDKRFPEIKRTSYRSLKDAMEKSPLIINLGGRSNYYILKEWGKNYEIGTVKKLIISYLENNPGPRHYFEVFKFISDSRPDFRLQETASVLSGNSEIFRHHRGGYYTLIEDTLEYKNNFKRIHNGVYNTIDENKKLISNQQALMALLKVKYPDMEDIQLEYAIFQYGD